MSRGGFSGDEVWGVFALGALQAGDPREAARQLARARPRYIVGFLARLAVVAPTAAASLAWRLGVKPFVRAIPDGGGHDTEGEV